jgi:hypothetical protein
MIVEQATVGQAGLDRGLTTVRLEQRRVPRKSCEDMTRWACLVSYGWMKGRAECELGEVLGWFIVPSSLIVHRCGVLKVKHIVVAAPMDEKKDFKCQILKLLFKFLLSLTKILIIL